MWKPEKGNGRRTFKLLSRLRVILVLVRVVFQRGLAIGLFDFILSGIWLDAQRIVELGFRDHGVRFGIEF